jgi:hypothetical protein
MSNQRKPLTAFVLALGILSVILSPARVNASTDVNLILHWNLNEGSGTSAFDDSGNSYDGVLYNGATYVSGHEGYGVSLNGVDQYVQTPTPFGFLGMVDQPYALSTWVNFTQAGASGNIFHMSSNVDGTGWCIPFLTLTNGHFAATGWDQADGEVDAVDPAVSTNGEWHQVISTWDPTNGLRLFVDGDLVSSTPQPDYAASGSPMYASLGLGTNACSNDQGYLDGIVDDARIYSRALLPEDVQSISTEGEPVVTPPDTQNSNGSGATTPGAPSTGIGPNQDSVQDDTLVTLLVSTLSVALLLAGLATLHYRRR